MVDIVVFWVVVGMWFGGWSGYQCLQFLFGVGVVVVVEFIYVQCFFECYQIVDDFLVVCFFFVVYQVRYYQVGENVENDDYYYNFQ